MRQNYKFFIKDVPIILTEQPLTLEDKGKETLVIEGADTNKIKDSIEYAETNPFHSRIVIQDNEINKLFQQFKSFFSIVEAAGGMVWSPQQTLLLIYRHQKWDLPKGKMEAGEEPEETASREISEECGVQDISINEFVTTTYHTYWQKNQRVLKITYWFDLISNDPQNINPQTEEGIETIRWMDTNGLQKAMVNTFPSLKILFELGIDKMKDPDF